MRPYLETILTCRKYQYKTVSNTNIKEQAVRCLRALEPYELFLSKVDGLPPPEARTYSIVEQEVEKTKSPTMCTNGHEMHKYSTSKAITIKGVRVKNEGDDISCKDCNK